MNKYLPAIVCGFGAAVLTIVPGIKNFGCFLFVPLAAAISLLLYKKTNHIKENIRANTGLFLGFFTGLVAAIFASSFDILLTYISRSNEFVESLPQSEEMMRDLNLGSLLDETIIVLRQMVNEIKQHGFSLFYTIGIFASNIITFSIFGIIGGLLGVLFINRRKR